MVETIFEIYLLITVIFTDIAERKKLSYQYFNFYFVIGIASIFPTRFYTTVDKPFCTTKLFLYLLYD